MKKNLLALGIGLVVFCNGICYGATQIPASAPTTQQTEESFNVIGGGIYTSFSPYEGKDPKITPVPIVKWRKDKIFVEGLKAGFVAYEDDNLEADVFLSPRLMGFDADESNSFDGMENRNYSLDGGVHIKWNIPSVEGAALMIGATSDLANEYKGQEGFVALSKSFKGSFFQLVPLAGIKWQSKQLVDYYYGVRDNEVKASRPAYKGDQSWNPFINIGFNMGLSQTCFLITRFDVEWLGKDIKKSPIVNKDVSCGILAGIAVKF